LRTEERCARERARSKKRYAEDPEFRARKRRVREAYRAANRPQINARRRHQWATDKEFRERQLAFRRNHRLLRSYGITWDDYKDLLVRQGGVCGICKKLFASRLCVDHCHARRTVRGLLCIKCNAGLGCFDDDPERLRAAIAYLERARGKG
jgi:hypothetical protein